MNTVQFEVNYLAPSKFDHDSLIRQLAQDISDKYFLSDYYVEPYDNALSDLGIPSKRTHTATIEFASEKVERNHIYKQLKTTMEKFSISKYDPPMKKIKLFDIY